MQLGGIHHLTAITSQASANWHFYTRVLGLRLVKKTVNQDDVFAYHLFYGDGVGSPGTDMTFFEWPVPPERRGTCSIIRTSLRVTGAETLAWWGQRFKEHGVRHEPIVERDGRATLDFEDPEGQRLCLVDDGGKGESHPWAESPVPQLRQIRGLGPVIISVPDLAPTARMLADVLQMRLVREYPGAGGNGKTAFVYEMGNGGPAAELHVVVEPESAPARFGAGGVHHVAFRAPGLEDFNGWIRSLKELGVPSSGPVERFYFKSLYFHDPSGVLFEIATDEPGFTVDEPIDRLGNGLALPPFLEPRRREIEAGLKPL